MKLQKLVILVCVFFLLNIALAYALDLAPVFTKFEESSNDGVTAVLDIQAYDAATNPGISWIKLYEDNVVISQKSCGSQASCSWQPQISHPGGGVFSYYAVAMDKGGNSKTSDTIQVVYGGKILSACALNINPPTPSLYGDLVIASCSCSNTEAPAVLTRNGTDVTAAENFQFAVLSAGAHDYECSVIETQNYTSATTGIVTYTVDPAQTNLTLNASPSWAENEGIQTTVTCSADNAEVNVELYRDGVLVSNPDVQTLTNGNYTYTCNSTASQNYTAGAEVSQNLTIGPAPPCVTPVDDLVITTDTILCDGTYFIDDVNGDGAVIINSSDVTLSCNNTQIIGTNPIFGVGISVYNHDRVVIQNCYLESFDIGIEADSTINSTIQNNYINNAINDGISLFYSSGVNIDNNTIENGGGGLSLDESNSSTITNNQIRDCDDYGIELWDAYNNLFTDNTLDNVSMGIELDYSDNNTFIRTLLDNNEESISIEDSIDAVFFDSVLSNTLYEDILLDYFSLLTLVNTSFNKTNVDIYDSDLIVQWYLDVYVNDTLGAPVENATVTAYQQDGSQVFTSQTDSSGNIPQQIVTEYTQNQTTVTDFNPYTINVTAALYNTENVQANITDNAQLTVALTPVTIAATGNVVINEFMADGVIPTTEYDEFIELYNNDSVLIDISGWNLGDSASNYTVPAGNLLNPGDFFSVNRSVSGIALNNGGDTINVYNSSGDLIDTYIYTASAEGISFGLYPDGTGTWQDMAMPTPGASNIPVVNVLWSTSALDLGSGSQSAGNLTGTANITSENINTNVDVVCSSGSCIEITNDWTIQNMTDAQTEIVTFTCSDLTVGTHSALFEVSSDEYPTGNSINVSCEILLVPIYNVLLADPTDQSIMNDTTANYIITVTNLGNVQDSFDLNVDNIGGASTAVLNQTTITNLGAGLSADVILTVGDPAPGTYTVNVTAVSQADITATDEVEITTIVSDAPVYSVSIVNLNASQQITNSQTAAYNIQVTNTGNQVDSYDLIVNNLDNATTADLDTYTISGLNPGVSSTVQLSVADSTVGLYDVTVTAVSQTNSSINDTTAIIQTDIVQAVGNMSGTVSDSDNNIYNALVELRQSASVIASTYTDASGSYSFSNIAVGTYDVVVIKAGFNNDILQDTVNEGTNTVHDVTLTPAVFAGTISGTVLDGTDGTTTIPGATITITRSDNFEVVQIIISDAVGNYVFNGLSPTVGFTYDLDVNPVPSPYTTAFPPAGLSLTSGQILAGKNIYLI